MHGLHQKLILSNFALQVEFRNLDLLDRVAVDAIFKEFSFGAVIHFAGIKVSGVLVLYWCMSPRTV